MKHLLTIGLTLIFVACGQKNNNEKSVEKKDSVTLTTQKQDSVMTQKEDIKTIHKSDFEKFLNNPKTPKMATELYHNTYKLKGDEPLELLENLESKDVQKRWFYFRVITNSYKISDSSYSEGLGNVGKEYIENKTCEFATYFDNKECFTDKDLETWADIALLEFEIIGETDNGYDKKIVVDYNKKIKENCKNSTTNQKATIEKFCKLLDTKYNEYINRQ
jgi:hypothetical protein